MIITIDGPSGTGKTTVAESVAKELNFVYFDTGAMYRALTWYISQRKISLSDEAHVDRCLADFNFSVREKEGKKQYCVGDIDVTDLIRSESVTKEVSAVAALKQVRSNLLSLQRRFAKGRNAIFEGRDLGTVVFPQAGFKVFLTADPKVRAKRRLLELLAKEGSPQGLTEEKVLEDLAKRDELDSKRDIAPLRCPEDAVVIDTTHLSLQAVIAKIVKKYRKAVRTPAWAKKSNTMTLLYRSILFLAWGFFKLLYRHRVYGQEHVAKGSGILAANHASFYDPPVLAISSPEEVHFLARETLFKNPLFGYLIRKLNSHPVKGGSADIGVFKAIHELLVQGKKVILFPEGTRGDTEDLGELKPGIALLIARAQSAVIPAYIHGTFSVWSRFRSFPKFFGKTACIFGSPIHWEDFAHLEKKEGQKALLDKLSQSIRSLSDWYAQGAKGSPP